MNPNLSIFMAGDTLSDWQEALLSAAHVCVHCTVPLSFFSQLLSIQAIFLLPCCTNLFGASAADPVVSSDAAVCDCGPISSRKTSRQVLFKREGKPCSSAAAEPCILLHEWWFMLPIDPREGDQKQKPKPWKTIDSRKLEIHYCHFILEWPITPVPVEYFPSLYSV